MPGWLLDEAKRTAAYPLIRAGQLLQQLRLENNVDRLLRQLGGDIQTLNKGVKFYL